MGETIEARVEAVRARIEAACARAGRSADEVCLVAVAKKFGPDAVREAAEAGLTVIGENRVQEARQKIPLSPGGLHWHLVGHLQRNKVREAVALFEMVHSVDSRRLLEALDQACESAGRRMPVCLEVNVSGEASKFGLTPEDARALLAECGAFMNVDMVGLMTIPPFSPEPEDSRPHFRKLRELRGEWSASLGFALPELSMGMSGDFEVAIEEGATMVRVGTALFGRRKQ